MMCLVVRRLLHDVSHQLADVLAMEFLLLYLNFLSLGYSCKLCHNVSVFIMKYVYAPLIIIHLIH